MNFAKYSNGWGHLIVTLAVMAMVTALLVTKTLAPADGIGLLSIVISFWFMSGTVNRFSTTVPSSSASTFSPLPSIVAPVPQPLATPTQPTTNQHGG